MFKASPIEQMLTHDKTSSLQRIGNTRVQKESSPTGSVIFVS